MLADLGAEVIKIEPPAGDIARKHQSRTGSAPHNALFREPQPQARRASFSTSAATKVAKHSGASSRGAHALITNLRPSAIKKLGLTYDALRTWNPRLVCVALTGYGLDGPNANRPAYDYVIQAMTGIMYLTGDPSAPPTKAGLLGGRQFGRDSSRRWACSRRSCKGRAGRWTSRCTT